MTSEQERTAADLMVRAQAGDAMAYADLMVLLTGAARRFARGKVGAVPWVEDVAQETLLSIHAARHTYDPRRPFAPWFYAIVGRRLIDVLRRERRISGRELGVDTLPDRAGCSDDTVLDASAIHAALATLPVRQRAVVEGLKLRGETVREAGQRLGMTEGSVKVAAHRGYKALRKLLGGRS